MDSKISKILVCIDGSDPSLQAAKTAVEIAENYKAKKIIALNVCNIPMSVKLSKDKQERVYQFDLDQANKWLEDITREAAKNNIALEIDVLETSASPVSTIVNYAESKGMDLIVVGDTGRSRFERALLGSVAHGVMTYAKCSVLVVR